MLLTYSSSCTASFKGKVQFRKVILAYHETRWLQDCAASKFLFIELHSGQKINLKATLELEI